MLRALFLIFAAVVYLGRHISIICREEWGARLPKATANMSTPVPLVIIHHSHMAPCMNYVSCVESVTKIQDFHMDVRGWDDIGYNFLIGGLGQIFEGRGWQRVGAHASNYNNKSIGICLIGDFSEFLPLQVQLDAAKDLTQYGVDRNYIMQEYILYGHRDVRVNNTIDCPGKALYKEISEWPHKGHENSLMKG